MCFRNVKFSHLKLIYTISVLRRVTRQYY
uniref:Uncharacterized protein n=1 Tax=Arundo donax TaxID=35708 RepID=A0A0A9BEL7_ARUDO